jgi:hypothetical protein
VNQKETNCLVYFWVFAGDGDSHHRRRKTEGKKTLQIPWFFGVSSGGAWTHAPPVAVVCGTTRRHCSSGSGRLPSTVMTFLGAVFVIVNCLM